VFHTCLFHVRRLEDDLRRSTHVGILVDLYESVYRYFNASAFVGIIYYITAEQFTAGK